MFSDIPKFTDFEQESFLMGDKIKIEEILNKEVVFTSMKTEPSKMNKGEDYLKVQIADGEIDGKPIYKIFFSSSKVLMKQFKKYKSFMPFKATIIKQKSYYTLA